MKYLKRIAWLLILILLSPIWMIVIFIGSFICFLLGVIKHICTWESLDDLFYYMDKFDEFITEDLPDELLKHRPE